MSDDSGPIHTDEHHGREWDGWEPPQLTSPAEKRPATTGGAKEHTKLGRVAMVQIVLGSLVGIWALVQGIVAAATDRGRKFGIAAIVVAGAAPIPSVLVWVVVGLAFGRHLTPVTQPVETTQPKSPLPLKIKGSGRL